MRYFFFLFQILVGVGQVYGDACADFCVAQLGRAACSKGSFCKRGHDCHALFWTSSDHSAICVFSGDGSCRNTYPVLCREAEERLRGGALTTTTTTTAIPSTTTVTTTTITSTTVTTTPVRIQTTSRTTRRAIDVTTSTSTTRRGAVVLEDYLGGSEEEFLQHLKDMGLLEDETTTSTTTITTRTTTATTSTRTSTTTRTTSTSSTPRAERPWVVPSQDCRAIISQQRTQLTDFVNGEERLIVTETSGVYDSAQANAIVQNAIARIANRLGVATRTIQSECTDRQAINDATEELEEMVATRTSQFPMMVNVWIHGRIVVEQGLARADDTVNTQLVDANEEQAVAIARELTDLIDMNMRDLRSNLGRNGVQIYRQPLQRLGALVDAMTARIEETRATAVAIWQAGADERTRVQQERVAEVTRQNEEHARASLDDNLYRLETESMMQLPQAQTELAADNVLQAFQEGLATAHNVYTRAVASLPASPALAESILDAVRVEAEALQRITEQHRCYSLPFRVVAAQSQQIRTQLSSGQFIVDLRSALLSSSPAEELARVEIAHRPAIEANVIAPATAAIATAFTGCANTRRPQAGRIVDAVIASIIRSIRDEPTFRHQVLSAHVVRELDGAETVEGADQMVAEAVAELEALGNPAQAQSFIAAIREKRQSVSGGLVSVNQAAQCRERLMEVIRDTKDALLDALERTAAENARHRPDDIEHGVTAARISTIRTQVPAGAAAIREAAALCTPRDAEMAEEECSNLGEFLQTAIPALIQAITQQRDELRAARELAMERRMDQIDLMIDEASQAFDLAQTGTPDQQTTQGALAALRAEIARVMDTINQASTSEELSVFRVQILAKLDVARQALSAREPRAAERLDRIRAEIRELRVQLQGFSQAVVAALRSAVDRVRDETSTIEIATGEITVALATFNGQVEAFPAVVENEIAGVRQQAQEAIDGLQGVLQRSRECRQRLLDIADAQIDSLGNILARRIVSQARSAVALIADTERAKQATLEGFAEAFERARVTIRAGARAECPAAALEEALERLGNVNSEVAAIVAAVEAFTRVRSEGREFIANFVVAVPPASVTSPRERADQMDRVIGRFMRTFEPRIVSLGELARVDLLQAGIEQLALYQRDQIARLGAARDALRVAFAPKQESEQLKTFAGRSMTFVLDAIAPLITALTVSGKTRSEIEGSLEGILAANAVIIAPLGQQVAAAGSSIEGFNRALRERVAAMLADGMKLRLQESNLKARIAAIEKAVLAAADRAESIDRARDELGASEELSAIGVDLQNPNRFEGEIAAVRSLVDQAIARLIV